MSRLTIQKFLFKIWGGPTWIINVCHLIHIINILSDQVLL